MLDRIKLNKLQKRILIIVFLILATPFFDQFEDNSTFNWSVFDFVLAFMLLASFGFGLEYLWRKINSKKIKFLVIVIFTFLFVLLWAELAVGIFNSPFAGN